MSLFAFEHAAHKQTTQILKAYHLVEVNLRFTHIKRLLQQFCVVITGWYWLMWYDAQGCMIKTFESFPEFFVYAISHDEASSLHKGKHYDVIKWKYFPRYLPFVRGLVDWSLVDSLHKGQWRGTLIFFLCSAPEQTVEQTIETPVIWDAHNDVSVMK